MGPSARCGRNARLRSVPNRLRVVLDTNVFVRGLMQRRAVSPAREVLHWWRLGVYDLCASGVLIDEVARTLVEKLGFSRSVADGLIATLGDAAEIVPLLHQKMGCRDTDDDHLLETALVARAHIIVSCDKDVLNLPIHVTAMLLQHGIQVMSDVAFLEYIRSRVFSPIALVCTPAAPGPLASLGL